MHDSIATTDTVLLPHEASLQSGLLRCQHSACTARATWHRKRMGSIAVGVCCALSACSDGTPRARDLTLDAQAPSGPEAGSDARVSLDGSVGLDATVDAGAADAGPEACRAPSREACANSNVVSVTRSGLTCTGDTPVFCHPYYSSDGDAGPDYCRSTDAGSGPFVGGGLRMTFCFACDDTNDCPVGFVCTGQFAKPFNQLTGTSCTPACVDPGPSSSYQQQLCKQDCECGPGSTCLSGGTCSRPGAI